MGGLQGLWIVYIVDKQNVYGPQRLRSFSQLQLTSF